MASLIDIDRWSYHIGGMPILRDITCNIAEGSCISLIGPNGAGKSTLLKSLVRIDADGTGSGSILIAGKPIRSYSQRDLASLVGYVPQHDGRYLDFTVRDFVVMGRYPYRTAFSSLSSDDEAAVDEALALTEITDLADRHLSTLSGGERQNTFIAAALAQTPRILLLDEPTTFLDPRHQRDILVTLRRIARERGITLLVVTHDVNHAVLISDRIIALRGGSVVFDGAPVELITPDALESIYHTNFIILRHPETGQRLVLHDLSAC